MRVRCLHYLQLESTWWRHQMETFSALLALCAGNSPVFGEFPAQRPVKLSFDVFFDLHLIKRLSKHSQCWLFETLSCPFWRHRDDIQQILLSDRDNNKNKKAPYYWQYMREYHRVLADSFRNLYMETVSMALRHHHACLTVTVTLLTAVAFYFQKWKKSENVTKAMNITSPHMWRFMI